MSVFTSTSYMNNMRERAAVDQDREITIVNHLVEVVTGAGLCRDPVDVVNLYVALKSKPLLILYGQPNSGKTALIQCLACTVFGGGFPQCQMLVGHPWSAEYSGNIAFFTGIHYRYNTEKLLSLIEEAWQPENHQRIFLACLMHISPAEIIDFFSSLSHQLSHEHIYQIGDRYFSKPIPYPPNLWIIGTIDRSPFIWWDSELLSNTMVLNWSRADHRYLNCPATKHDISDAQIEILSSLRRERNEVYKKLHKISANIRSPLKWFFELKSLLAMAGIPLPDTITDEIVTYLGNAWTRKGKGLFHPSHEENFSIGCDLAIAQILLPRLESRIDKSPVLRAQLSELFSGNYPRSAVFIDSH